MYMQRVHMPETVLRHQPYVAPTVSVHGMDRAPDYNSTWPEIYTEQIPNHDLKAFQLLSMRQEQANHGLGVSSVGFGLGYPLHRGTPLQRYPTPPKADDPDEDCHHTRGVCRPPTPPRRMPLSKHHSHATMSHNESSSSVLKYSKTLYPEILLQEKGREVFRNRITIDEFELAKKQTHTRLDPLNSK